MLYNSKIIYTCFKETDRQDIALFSEWKKNVLNVSETVCVKCHHMFCRFIPYHSVQMVIILWDFVELHAVIILVVWCKCHFSSVCLSRHYVHALKVNEVTHHSCSLQSCSKVNVILNIQHITMLYLNDLEIS